MEINTTEDLADAVVNTVRSIQAVPDQDAPQSIETHYQITALPPDLTYVRDSAGSSDTYTRFYKKLNDPENKDQGLSRRQYSQAEFSVVQTQRTSGDDSAYSGLTRLPEVFPIMVSGNPGFYYSQTYYTSAEPFQGYVLCWKQDGYMMELHNDYAISLEELMQIAESVSPES